MNTVRATLVDMLYFVKALRGERFGSSSYNSLLNNLSAVTTSGLRATRLSIQIVRTSIDFSITRILPDLLVIEEVFEDYEETIKDLRNGNIAHYEYQECMDFLTEDANIALCFSCAPWA